MKRRGFLMLAAAGTALAGRAAETALERTTAVKKTPGGGDPRMRGPFPILSTPYLEDGAVDFESLGKGVAFVADSGCPGVIWCQSNDAVDLLTFEEKVKGFEACARAMEGKNAMLTLGCNGTIESMSKEAEAVERIAAKYPKTNLAVISRPPDDGKTQDDIRAYYERLASIIKRPVIIQTYVNNTCPAPTVQLLIDLAKRYPKTFGYIKEESEGNKANERMIQEVAAKPVMHTVFSAWGGWQWLYQSRRCGSEGLVTERCAYAPLLAYIWRQMEDRDKKGTLTQAYALYRLLIDQRGMPGGLRGYSLYYFQRQGVFKTTVSRQYLKAKQGEQGTTAVGDNKKWKLEKLFLTELQKAELDECYDDMLRFVREN
ncbi:MAG: dihydrodipicolinate synthase family protein [Kiritimatiellae bacterium]|nr:dihydrodipicolinate synthase family protein [Kiritimatiellia bacterium]